MKWERNRVPVRSAGVHAHSGVSGPSGPWGLGWRRRHRNIGRRAGESVVAASGYLWLGRPAKVRLGQSPEAAKVGTVGCWAL